MCQGCWQLAMRVLQVEKGKEKLKTDRGNIEPQQVQKERKSVLKAKEKGKFSPLTMKRKPRMLKGISMETKTYISGQWWE